MSKVYLYSRVSTSAQTLAQQERTVYEWLNNHNMTVGEIISDEGVSGGVSYKDRNLGKILLPKLVEGDMLIVSEISRLGRSMFDLSKLIHTELKPRKVRLVVCNMGIDLNCAKMTAIDELILNNFSFAAQLEKQLISERTRSALEVKRKQGVKLGAANETYRRNYDNLTIEERRLRQMRKGVLKRQRYHESKDFVTFKRILEKVFPEYTEAEDVKDWKWGYINMKRENREKVLELMKDYKDLDNTGQLFRKFDFENDMEFCDARIHQYLQRFRNSCIGTTKEV
jgi:DNA invertase Pin-like site-specific DNA recombinase